MFVFKFYQNAAPVYIMDSLVKSARDEYILIVPRTSTRYGDRAFSNSAPRLWNDLPPSIRKSNTYGQFKAHLKRHLFANFYTFLSNVTLFMG